MKKLFCKMCLIVGLGLGFSVYAPARLAKQLSHFCLACLPENPTVKAIEELKKQACDVVFRRRRAAFISLSLLGDGGLYSNKQEWKKKKDEAEKIYKILDLSYYSVCSNGEISEWVTCKSSEGCVEYHRDNINGVFLRGYIVTVLYSPPLKGDSIRSFVKRECYVEDFSLGRKCSAGLIKKPIPKKSL